LSGGSASTRNDSQLEQAVSRLSFEPRVSAVSWTVTGAEDKETMGTAALGHGLTAE
jgi:hypothetical protein